MTEKKTNPVEPKLMSADEARKASRSFEKNLVSQVVSSLNEKISESANSGRNSAYITVPIELCTEEIFDALERAADEAKYVVRKSESTDKGVVDGINFVVLW